MDIFLTSLSAIITAFIAFLPFLGEVTVTTQAGSKVLTTRGRIVLSLTVVGIVVILLQKLNSDEETRTKENETKAEQKKRDKEQKQAYDSSLIAFMKQADYNNRQTIVAITKTELETLGKYGFKLDSTENRLVKVVRDSSKTVIIEGADPVLGLCPRIGMILKNSSDEFYNFTLNFCSHDASSTDYNLKFHLVLADSLKHYYYIGDRIHPLPRETRIGKDLGFYSGFEIQKLKGLAVLYIYMTGTYKNFSKSKEYKVDEVYYYDLNQRSFGHSLNQESKDVLKTIKADALNASK